VFPIGEQNTLTVPLLNPRPVTVAVPETVVNVPHFIIGPPPNLYAKIIAALSTAM
jgi:hypothetical protein